MFHLGLRLKPFKNEMHYVICIYEKIDLNLVKNTKFDLNIKIKMEIKIKGVSVTIELSVGLGRYSEAQLSLV